MCQIIHSALDMSEREAEASRRVHQEFTKSLKIQDIAEEHRGQRADRREGGLRAPVFQPKHKCRDKYTSPT